jgi:hypothetical protein
MADPDDEKADPQVAPDAPDPAGPADTDHPAGEEHAATNTDDESPG